MLGPIETPGGAMNLFSGKVREHFSFPISAGTSGFWAQVAVLRAVVGQLNDNKISALSQLPRRPSVLLGLLL